MQREPKKDDTRGHRKHVLWRRMVACLAVMVVIVTGYALILPAVTMERQAGDVSGEGTEWEETLPETLTGDWRMDLAAVAESQTGYADRSADATENSTEELGSGNRYETWYGEEANDWNGMFLAFCLHYAEIPEDAICKNAAVSEVLRSCQEGGFYQEAGQYEPERGDLAFLADGHVGIVTETSAEGISVIEGDVDGSVATAGQASPLGYADLGTAQAAYTGNTGNQAEGNTAGSADGIQTDENITGNVIGTPAGSTQPDSEATGGAGLSGSSDAVGDLLPSAGEGQKEQGETDLEAYVLERGFGTEAASFVAKLVDSNDQEVVIGNDGKYHVYKGELYTWSISLYAPAGIPEQGDYVYQIPEGIEAITDQVQKVIVDNNEPIGEISIEANSGKVVLSMEENTKIRLRIYFEIEVYFPTDDEGESISDNIEIAERGEDATIEKSVEINSDGNVEWTIAAHIPKYEGGAYHSWFIYDFTNLETGGISYPDIRSGTVTITSGGKTGPIPSVTDASAEDKIAYWWVEHQGYNPETEVLYLLTRMDDDSHQGPHNTLEGKVPEGWCVDWYLEEDATITIKYEDGKLTDFNELISNNAQLRQDSTSLNDRGTQASRANAEIDFPSVFDKATYGNSGFKITFNESILDLSGIGEIEIRDEMGANLFYRLGSMEITATDAAGIPQILVYGQDYTLTVSDDFHDLTITILDPGAYCYEITYGVSIGDGNNNSKDDNENTASVTIFGKNFEVSEDGSNFSADASEYEISIVKTDQDDNNVKVEGATYGLYASNGQLLAKGVTLEDGTARFTGAPAAGFILSSNQLYYLQELAAPEGYAVSMEKYWFYYVESDKTIIETLLKTAELEDRYNGEEINVVKNGGKVEDEEGYIAVEDSRLYELPETGSIGTMLYTIAGMLLTGSAGTALYKRNKKGRKQR